MSLLGELRAHTSNTHREIQSLPYHMALRENMLTSLPIISLLRCLAIIHGNLENELKSCTDARVKSLWNMGISKLQLLNNDLQVLDSETKPVVASALELSLKMCRPSVEKNEFSPMFLIGVLYVVEGFQNGGMSLKKMVAKCLNISPDQLSYFGTYGVETSNHWADFARKLDAISCTPKEAQEVIEGAQYAFDNFKKIIQLLYPIAQEDLIYHSAAINPEAGDHGVPQNLEEIEIAILAGQNAWKRYPYLEARFHERGQRFKKSDSCWILNLYHLGASSIRKNVFWLRNLLALRGIPSVILESHMEEILKQLELKWPHGKQEFSDFGAVILDLNTIRLKQIHPNLWHDLTDKYEYLLQQTSGYKVPGAANLLVSAWADELSGISNAFSATQEWFIDPVRFSESWIAIVQELSLLLKGTKP